MDDASSRSLPSTTPLTKSCQPTLWQPQRTQVYSYKHLLSGLFILIRVVVEFSIAQVTSTDAKHNRRSEREEKPSTDKGQPNPYAAPNQAETEYEGKQWAGYERSRVLQEAHHGV